MSALVDVGASAERRSLGVQEFGELVPISRFGGQGRVYRPALVPAGLGAGPMVVKLYRRAPPAGAEQVLMEMVAWGHLLSDEPRETLQRVAAWPLAIVRRGEVAAGVVMRDVSGRFSAPFVMPSGRRDSVLLTLEHLLGADDFLQMRGLGVRLDTFSRTEVAERICDALAFLHRHAIVASDIAPNNVLIAFGAGDEPEACLIDCDSMVFHGRQALTAVQTGDWELPAAYGESPNTRAADAYKLGLVVLRLFARSHDARAAGPYLQYVPAELRRLLVRALDADAVNRPPAGEWQRALRGLLADGRLNERYPGPAPTPRVVVRRAPAAPSPEAAVVRAPGGAARAVAPGAFARAAGAAAPGAFVRAAGAAAPALQFNGALWLKRAVVVAWIVAGTAVLLLVLSRLFAAAVPVPDAGNAGAGSQSQFGSGANSPYIYQYYYPGRRGELAFPPDRQPGPLTVTYGDLTGRPIGWRTRRKCASSLADGLPEPRSWGPAAAPGRDSRPGPPAGPQIGSRATAGPPAVRRRARSCSRATRRRRTAGALSGGGPGVRGIGSRSSERCRPDRSRRRSRSRRPC